MEHAPIPEAGRAGGPPGRSLRVRTAAAAALAVLFGCLYFFVRQYFKDGVWRFDLTLVNKSLGATALFIIALSMALTGAAHFSRPWIRRLAYRKYLGLAGFWAGVAHAALGHLVLPAVGLRTEQGPGGPLADAAGLAALGLFTVMAAISNGGAMSRMGPAAWRGALRWAGYAGLVLAAGHTALLKWGSWARYFRTFESVLPSLSLPAVVLAAAAVLLRLTVLVSGAGKRK